MSVAQNPPTLQQAVALHRQGQLAEAEAIYRTLLAREPEHFEALQLLGAVSAQQQRFPEAVRLLRLAIGLKPSVAAVHHNLGNALQSLQQHTEALACYEEALRLQPRYPEALHAKANAHKALKQWPDALQCYDMALALQPDPHSHLNRGNVLRNMGRDEDALLAYDAALALAPDMAQALYNRGNALLALKRYDEALGQFDRALRIQPDSAETLNNRGSALLALKRHDEAIADYDRAIALRPGYASAWFNRGNALQGLRQYDAALEAYEKALAHDPSFADAFNGRGVVMMKQERQAEAIEAYEKAIALRPDYVEALHNLGDALMLARKFARAANAYERALGLDAANKYVLGAIHDCRQHGCDWSDHALTRAQIVAGVRQGLPVCSPFVFLSVADDPADHLACARTFAADRHPPAPEPLWKGERYRHARLRVAYLSADFHSHAVAFLTAELFELHDRARFELFAYSLSRKRPDAMRARLEGAFDSFTDVAGLSDLEVAQLMRRHEIDIAVDLNGFTLHCRPDIFSYRAVPIQVNFLGYPGTMGAPYMDYIIGDATVIPPEHGAFYAEAVVRLPDVYQPNDRQREVADRTPSRAEMGLPQDGFVFCCFNNNYKITPDIFSVWMRLLKAVPGSVLWLLADNAEVTAHLRRAAMDEGVENSRIVFAPRMELAQHLARHRSADLFLDTLPYNAHTTASDALWAGLPVLTCMGNAFPARVAASLLKAAGVPELITESLPDYEARALQLARHPEDLAVLRRRLHDSRLTSALFDTQRFCTHIEAAYLRMHERHLQGASPEGFDVPAQASAPSASPTATHRATRSTTRSGPGAGDAFREGTALLRQGKLAEALAWLDRALALKPDDAPAQSNRAAALLHLGRFEEARLAAQRATEVQPSFADGWNNLGSAAMKLRRYPEALVAYDNAVRLNPASADVHNNRGIALDALKRHAEAALAYATVRKIDPRYRGIHSSELFALRKACVWPNGAEPGGAGANIEAEVFELVRQKRPVAPFVLMAVTDDLPLLLDAAQCYGRERYPPSPSPLWNGERYGNRKIRLAYLSADFHSHATAYLMAELFETHDSERFETWGISFGPDVKSDAMRDRLKLAFDHFIDVADRTDLEIAQLIRGHQIDIAVDLKGYTQDCRPGILGHRPAPVQVNYLGFPGTMGAAHIDYIIGDATVTPPEHEPFYAEKVVRLPDSYQVNDRKREIGTTPSRSELGLPESGFVFCCFNNSYKITPEFFDIWMRVLHGVPGSVLWLLEASPEASANLKKQALDRGVDPDRLVFAPKMPLAGHLARQRQADLFLDTLPYNAHTTTSDALWVGLPVVTCLGGAFAGRVAASLLKAAGLPELITADLADYEQRILRLATQPAELREARRKLEAQRMTCALFDTDRFRRHLETAFARMHQRREQGQSPAGFDVTID